METDPNDAVGRVVAVLRDAGGTEATVRHYRSVLEGFAAFLTACGLGAASEGGVHRVHLEPDRRQAGFIAGTGR